MKNLLAEKKEWYGRIIFLRILFLAFGAMFYYGTRKEGCHMDELYDSISKSMSIHWLRLFLKELFDDQRHDQHGPKYDAEIADGVGKEIDAKNVFNAFF